MNIDIKKEVDAGIGQVGDLLVAEVTTSCPKWGTKFADTVLGLVKSAGGSVDDQANAKLAIMVGAITIEKLLPLLGPQFATLLVSAGVQLASGVATAIPFLELGAEWLGMIQDWKDNERESHRAAMYRVWKTETIPGPTGAMNKYVPADLPRWFETILAATIDGRMIDAEGNDGGPIISRLYIKGKADNEAAIGTRQKTYSEGFVFAGVPNGSNSLAGKLTQLTPGDKTKVHAPAAMLIRIYGAMRARVRKTKAKDAGAMNMIRAISLYEAANAKLGLPYAVQEARLKLACLVMTQRQSGAMSAQHAYTTITTLLQGLRLARASYYTG